MKSVLLLAALVLVAGLAHAQGEPFRPQFHFTPERNWMNDPNGKCGCGPALRADVGRDGIGMTVDLRERPTLQQSHDERGGKCVTRSHRVDGHGVGSVAFVRGLVCDEQGAA